MYDARQIANWFVDRAAKDGRKLSIMQLLKLVYISHGWHLEMYGSPLIINKIEAWKYGPVIPDVYNAFRRYGVDISMKVNVKEVLLAPHDKHLLEQIYNTYGKMEAHTLSDITHETNGPWHQATTRRGYFAPITNDLILDHYKMKRRKAAS